VSEKVDSHVQGIARLGDIRYLTHSDKLSPPCHRTKDSRSSRGIMNRRKVIESWRREKYVADLLQRRKMGLRAEAKECEAHVLRLGSASCWHRVRF
jgi:hypothetical protein